ncbi:zinc-dependent metalloprotease [Pedobacter sp.]|jgi:hypothetical protein|uniref:zinc-dependent metalloprotease n=1 Tax=Pedobacter sp. TaxID=1411316 RepID=UPI002BDD04A8|nr:zinc-dependent metalloprotease [Pedobacter sp.]HWW39962.1 zinc-dependent metalloprotease [Pedobacter sp.]
MKLKQNKLQYALLCIFLMGSIAGFSQEKPKKHRKSKDIDTVKAIVVKPPVPAKMIKTYASVINKNFKTQKGLFGVHRFKDTTYFEIADTLLKRDIMVINRLTKAPGDYGMFPGEELDEKTIQFERGSDSTIKVRFNLVVSEADSSNAISKAVRNANLNPIVASFPIKAYSKDSSSFVIDVSKFLTELNFVNSIDPSVELSKNLTVVSQKDVFIESIHVYPSNVELAIRKNMESKRKGDAPQTTVTLETHTSFIALPKVPMQRRFFDRRVGYFANQYKSFSDDQQRAEVNEYIVRWRLEPKEQDIEKWKKGELVEPKKPIVIYIDPATPKQWRPFLIKGIEDWQVAFEKAGFKNAIIGKEWPENDTTMHMDDARYSMLNYFPSEVANAYGPHISDPRSGEIIQTHIGWYHNVMDLLHKWYMIQAAAVDPQARKPKFDEQLMGQLIRFVSSHEIGHTLGLRHNFGSSSQTPVDSLRNINYLKKHGHTVSIMDYARFNYVAQPEDHIPQALLFPRIGEYDQWAIEWGYKSSHAANSEEDKTIVRQWIVNRTSKNRRLWFGDGETIKGDPRCQTEDLGDNSAKASVYGIRNLKRILPNLPAWTHEKGGLYGSLTRSHEALLGQYQRYMGHVLKNIGGFYRDYKSEDQKGEVYSVTPKRLQQQALDFFNKELFNTPFWLLNADVQNKALDPFTDEKQNLTAANVVDDLQIRVLNSLLDSHRLHQMIANSKRFGVKAYPVMEYIGALHRGIWKELKAKEVKVDNYRRNLQKSYLGSLIDLMTAKAVEQTETDASSIARGEMVNLRQEIKLALPKTKDLLTRYHFMDLESRIAKLLSVKG